MSETEPQEIELTLELMKYVHDVAIHEAEQYCPNSVDYDDVVQEVYLKLLSRPPKYDPSRGAAVKTLLFTVVQRIVNKYLKRQYKHLRRFKQFEKPEAKADETNRGKESAPQPIPTSKRIVGLPDKEAYRATKIEMIDEMLELIDSEESRDLCRLVIECDGNISKAARCLGLSEGTVRYRLRLLAPKLLAAGFDPFPD